jgi:hypothetical protein
VANLEMAWKMVLKPGLFYKKAVFVWIFIFCQMWDKVAELLHTDNKFLVLLYHKQNWVKGLVTIWARLVVI